MRCINDNSKFIIAKLYTEMQGLSAEARRDKYKSEIKEDIKNLLKNCYPNQLRDKIVFYQESINSWISFYESETLMLNLFLDRDCAFIVNSLCKIEAFDAIKTSQLSKLTNAFLEYINHLENNEFTENDEKLFIQSFFMSLVPSMTDSDWHPKENDNSLITKFLSWFNENLNFETIELAVIGFITFIKLWDCFNEFSRPFNNKKAIYFYNGVNSSIKDRLSNLNADIYAHFINMIQKVTLSIFVDLNYVPLFDDKVSNKYSNGYLFQRKMNKDLLNQALEIEKISTSWSYNELIKEVSDDSPEYFVIKYLDTIIEKIKSSCYPSVDEIKGIIEIQSNKNIDVLKSKLLEKLYLFETIGN